MRPRCLRTCGSIFKTKFKTLHVEFNPQNVMLFLYKYNYAIYIFVFGYRKSSRFLPNFRRLRSVIA